MFAFNFPLKSIYVVYAAYNVILAWVINSHFLMLCTYFPKYYTRFIDESIRSATLFFVRNAAVFAFEGGCCIVAAIKESNPSVPRDS